MHTLTKNDKQVKPNNPQKFLLWIGIAAIVMSFAGLTSAYLVKEANSNWLEFSLPIMFSVSTGVIILSSLTMHLALRAYKSREIKKYRQLVTLTGILGLAFCICQFLGYSELYRNGVQLFGTGSNPAASFVGVISLLHIAHVLGGIAALATVIIKSYSSKIKSYDNTLAENVATYWHFVDILWIYLFIFFNIA